jgi:hypothetical protein|tara:strand:- start:1375 stop:1680 length:306 start_codon:yes stop_codon:yes gene_type:complete
MSKVFTTEQLIRIVDKNMDKNVGPNEEALCDLEPNGWHLVRRILVHNGVEYRCRVALCVQDSKMPRFVFIDMEFEDYEQGHDPDHVIKQAELLKSWRIVDG